MIFILAGAPGSPRAKVNIGDMVMVERGRNKAAAM